MTSSWFFLVHNKQMFWYSTIWPLWSCLLYQPWPRTFLIPSNSWAAQIFPILNGYQKFFVLSKTNATGPHPEMLQAIQQHSSAKSKLYSSYPQFNPPKIVSYIKQCSIKCSKSLSCYRLHSYGTSSFDHYSNTEIYRAFHNVLRDCKHL